MARCFNADGQAPTEFWGILYAELKGFCGTDFKNAKVLFQSESITLLLVAESAITLFVTAFWNTSRIGPLHSYFLHNDRKTVYLTVVSGNQSSQPVFSSHIT